MPDAAAGGKPPRHDKQAAAKPAAGKPKAGGPGGIHDPHAAREAGRYVNPIASREAILQLLVDADGPQSADALAEQLRLTEPDRFDALAKRLGAMRSEEHTSELQSLMRISYAVFCLKKKKR